MGGGSLKVIENDKGQVHFENSSLNFLLQMLKLHLHIPRRRLNMFKLIETAKIQTTPFTVRSKSIINLSPTRRVNWKWRSAER